MSYFYAISDNIEGDKNSRNSHDTIIKNSIKINLLSNYNFSYLRYQLENGISSMEIDDKEKVEQTISDAIRKHQMILK